MPWILVSLKADEGGTVNLLCTGLKADPLFPGKIVIENIQGLSLPFSDHWMKVQNWSVEKELIMDWKVGAVRKDFDITPEMLEKGEVSIPRLPGSLPTADLANHKDEVTINIAKEASKEEEAAAKEGQEPAEPGN